MSTKLLEEMVVTAGEGYKFVCPKCHRASKETLSAEEVTVLLASEGESAAICIDCDESASAQAGWAEGVAPRGEIVIPRWLIGG